MDFLLNELGLAAISVIAVLATAIYIMTKLRRVVPTNMTHIVQTSKATTPYGRGKAAGNTYYAWPSWVPVIGISVIEFPESIFQVSLDSYDAYDQARLPFIVDAVAFFKVDQAELAAQRVSSFPELKDQLSAVLQGAVRRILATNPLEEIMQSRSDLGNQFTEEVKEQIKEWGVFPVKTIEFMDLRDANGSAVIANIMAKEKSRIERESRIAVAENHRTAELAEIDARRTVDVQRQDAEQQVGLRTAEKDRVVGIANEQSAQEIKVAAKVTAERDMDVRQVNEVRAAEIEREVASVAAERDKKVAVIQAEADKQTRVVRAEGEKLATVAKAEGDLEASLREADGVRATGTAKADAEKALQLAPVAAQIELAKEIGSNDGYQTYLIKLKQVEAGQAVGIEMAGALAKADLKIISTGGGEGVQQSAAGLADIFTPAGGTKLTGMLAALAQTEEGQAVIGRLTGGGSAGSAP